MIARVTPTHSRRWPSDPAAPRRMPAQRRRARFVQWIRAASPYVHAFRGQDVRDRVRRRGRRRRRVPRHHPRPQPAAQPGHPDRGRPRLRGRRSRRSSSSRTSTAATHSACALPTRETMDCVLEAAGQVRSRIEALLSLGIANSPMAGARNPRVVAATSSPRSRWASSTASTCMLTGEVRRVDTDAIHQRLDDGDIVLISPLGYSPTGEILQPRCSRKSPRRSRCASSAHKLVFLMETGGRAQWPQAPADRAVDARCRGAARSRSRRSLPRDVQLLPARARSAPADNGVKRAHLISRHRRRRAAARALHARRRRHDGRRGSALAHIAQRDDRRRRRHPRRSSSRSRSRASSSAARASGSRARSSASSSPSTTTRIIGCAALYAFPDEKVGELAALAVHPGLPPRGLWRGADAARSRRARASCKLTRAVRADDAHRRNGSSSAASARRRSPTCREQKQALYNYQRKSQVYRKDL